MLGAGPATVGRGLGNDLVVDDGRVSRRHLQVRAQGGGVLVEDLGSRNGTYVGGLRLMGVRVVPAGERIRIGRTVLVVGGAVTPARPPHPVPAPCRRARALIERDLDDELTSDGATFLGAHLEGCPGCRSRHDLAAAWRTILRHALVEAPPPGLAERVERALQAEPDR